MLWVQITCSKKKSPLNEVLVNTFHTTMQMSWNISAQLDQLKAWACLSCLIRSQSSRKPIQLGLELARAWLQLSSACLIFALWCVHVIILCIYCIYVIVYFNWEPQWSGQAWLSLSTSLFSTLQWSDSLFYIVWNVGPPTSVTSVKDLSSHNEYYKIEPNHSSSIQAQLTLTILIDQTLLNWLLNGLLWVQNTCPTNRSFSKANHCISFFNIHSYIVDKQQLNALYSFR